MLIKITKGAREYGYVIWSSKRHKEFVKMIDGLDKVKVIFNGFNLGFKNIDWRFNRISIGYKFTRALPEDVEYFDIRMEDDILKVDCK